jgi:NarL family two-component system response regulator LiaR
MFNNQPKIRVLVADDHDLVRRGFAAFVRATPDLELVGEARNGQEAVDLAQTSNPDVIILDLIMPVMDGVTAIKAIRKLRPTQHIIVLTSFVEQNLVRQAMQAGAVGYLTKDTASDELADAIRASVMGRITLSNAAAQVLINSPAEKARQQYQLTDRELEVIRLMVKGKSNPEIADQLVITRSTVKFHVSAVLAKLGASSRTEAVAIALEQGLVS